jgi:pimeloyl-ACP methyl ester carboxylesterase
MSVAFLTLAAAAAMASQDVSIPGPHGPLAATLVDPGRNAPALILIPGSGPTDRNGDNPAGVAGGVYRQLAEQLAKRGVATLRIDKRGMFGSKTAIPDGNKVTIADYAADVRDWTRFLRARGRKCAWIAGHSEGGLVALAAAQRPEGICGLVLLAAPGRRLGLVLREQLKPKLPPQMYASADAAIVKFEARQHVDPAAVPAPLAGLFNPAVQDFLIDLLAQDPARLAAGTRLPLLVVQGDNDIQVGVEDARVLAAAHPGAKLVLLPGVNHVWRKAPTDAAANAATYSRATIPVDPAVATAIAAFVKSKR